MADFIDIINARGHMCQKYFLERSIHKCPLYKQTAAGCGDCAAWLVGHPTEAENIIRNWMEKNMKKETMLDVYLRETAEPNLLPNGYPRLCPAAFNPEWTGSATIMHDNGLWGQDEVCKNMKRCSDCWNRPAPEER